MRLSASISLLLFLAGCGQAPQAGRLVSQGPAAAPARVPATLALDEIEPKATLAATRPSTRPSTERASVEALTLYAEGVDALQTGRRFIAIGALEKALALDPDSFEINYALGRAHLIGRNHDEQAIHALERAAEINPDHLRIQADLGRQYLARGEQAKALHHLRLAVQTTAYKADEHGAAMADLFLARALQQNGYDRASLEQYARLLSRVNTRAAAHSLRSDPHLAFLITDQLYVDIADLYARNGQLKEALSIFEPAARRDPTDFKLETRVVRTLVQMGRIDEASRRAAELVVRFRASKESIELLREVHRDVTDEQGGAADALARTHAERPGDTTLLFALVELLREDGRWAQAAGVLAKQAERSPDDFDILRRRVHLQLQLDDPRAAARLIVETVAARPDFAAELDELWADVITPARANRLRLGQLAAMPVFPWEQAAKESCVAMVGAALQRSGTDEQAVARAVAIKPAFAPAFRRRLAQLSRPGGIAENEAERVRLTDELIATAAEADATLAQELKGLSLLYAKQDNAAAEALGKAVNEMGGKSPELLLAYARALRGAGDVAKFEQIMWKLLSDRPYYENAYSALYDYYSEANSDGQADRVLNTWIVAMPYSASARVLEAARHFRAGRADAARQVIARVLEDHGDREGVVRAAQTLYSRTGSTAALTSELERQLREQPGNLAALEVVAELYAQDDKSDQALRLFDAARSALGDDADHLYKLSHLYARHDQPQTTEQVLRQVIELEPAHVPASNDLGYMWADRGENLARAEALIRQAVEGQPHSASFLDSLGWVLYKRGRFAEARPHLERAASADAARVDPVVLDHLGDVLYRLGERAAAARHWDRAAAMLKEIGEDARADLKQLKVAVDRKTAESRAGGPVIVSPVVEESQQAKN